MVLLGLFACGVGLAVAAMQVYLRDTRHLVEVALQVWFWATPIVYTLDVAGLERYHRWFMVNPLVPFVDAFRTAIVAGAWPDAVSWAAVGGSAAITFLCGLALFARGQGRFAEYV
jgi:lipopolysaccharide transport system permease protein